MKKRSVTKENLKKGLSFWWGVDNTGCACPAIVVWVEEDWCKILSLDDFRRYNSSINSILDPKKKTCTRAERQEYLKKRTKRLKDIITKKTMEIEKDKKASSEYEKNVDAFLKTH